MASTSDRLSRSAAASICSSSPGFRLRAAKADGRFSVSENETALRPPRSFIALLPARGLFAGDVIGADNRLGGENASGGVLYPADPLR